MATKKGTDKNDVLTGGNSRYILLGLNGNDTLNGGNNSDDVIGGNGNDLIIGSRGYDAIDGGKGSDTISFAKFSMQVQVLIAGDNRGQVYKLVDFKTLADEDAIRNVENMVGSKFADQLRDYDSEGGYAYGGGGMDTISIYGGIMRGDAGIDTLNGSDSTIDTFWLQRHSG